MKLSNSFLDILVTETVLNISGGAISVIKYFIAIKILSHISQLVKRRHRKLIAIPKFLAAVSLSISRPVTLTTPPTHSTHSLTNMPTHPRKLTHTETESHRQDIQVKAHLSCTPESKDWMPKFPPPVINLGQIS